MEDLVNAAKSAGDAASYLTAVQHIAHTHTLIPNPEVTGNHSEDLVYAAHGAAQHLQNLQEVVHYISANYTLIPNQSSSPGPDPPDHTNDNIGEIGSLLGENSSDPHGLTIDQTNDSFVIQDGVENIGDHTTADHTNDNLISRASEISSPPDEIVIPRENIASSSNPLGLTRDQTNDPIGEISSPLGGNIASENIASSSNPLGLTRDQPNDALHPDIEDPNLVAAPVLPKRYAFDPDDISAFDEALKKLGDDPFTVRLIDLVQLLLPYFSRRFPIEFIKKIVGNRLVTARLQRLRESSPIPSRRGRSASKSGRKESTTSRESANRTSGWVLSEPDVNGNSMARWVAAREEMVARQTDEIIREFGFDRNDPNLDENVRNVMEAQLEAQRRGHIGGDWDEFVEPDIDDTPDALWKAGWAELLAQLTDEIILEFGFDRDDPNLDEKVKNAMKDRGIDETTRQRAFEVVNDDFYTDIYGPNYDDPIMSAESNALEGSPGGNSWGGGGSWGGGDDLNGSNIDIDSVAAVSQRPSSLAQRTVNALEDAPGGSRRDGGIDWDGLARMMDRINAREDAPGCSRRDGDGSQGGDGIDWNAERLAQRGRERREAGFIGSGCFCSCGCC